LTLFAFSNYLPLLGASFFVWWSCFISKTTRYQKKSHVLAVDNIPNMIGLTVKNIIIRKQLIFFFQCTWCSILYYFRGLSQCRLAGLPMFPLKWTTNIVYC
jgi:hypothetical protein